LHKHCYRAIFSSSSYEYTEVNETRAEQDAFLDISLNQAALLGMSKRIGLNVHERSFGHLIKQRMDRQI